MSSIAIRYETSVSSGYRPVLSNSDVVSGPIASQNAGSTNLGIYYQVGGGGVNGLFHDALCGSKPGDLCPHQACLDTVNADLVTAYDATYGAGAWKKDSASPPDPLPLTSFLVPIPSGCSSRVGANAVAMMYSVGPDMSSETSFSNPTGYTQIYADAMAQTAAFLAAGHALDGLRLTMLSTGIYKPRVADKAAFYAEVAGCILDAVVAGAKAAPALAGVTVLINTNGPGGKEQTAFDTAATKRGLSPDAAGFDVPIS
ncbi:MAG: hypothetical protein AAGI52_11695 [Bacteroidota bacterium]